MIDKTKAITLAASIAALASSQAAITYIDATAGSTVEFLNGTTWDGGTGWQANVNSGSDGLYQPRTTGPGANAANGNAFITGHSEDSPTLRMLITGLDAATTYQFYLYSVNAGGSDIIQAAASSDTGSTAITPSLITYEGGTNVLANGDEGNAASGDQRTRHTLTTLSGSTSYAIYIDDFNPDPGPGDRVTLDGIGFEAIPEPSSTALLGLAGLGFLIRRKR